MKTIIILSLLCLCFNGYAQYPVILTPGYPTVKNVANLECTACSIRPTFPQTTYWLFPYVEPNTPYFNDQYDNSMLPPGVNISFNTVKGKTYLLRIFFNPEITKAFTISYDVYFRNTVKTVYYPNKSKNDVFTTAFTSEGGRIRFRMTGNDTLWWVFQYCTIAEINETPPNL